MREIIDVLGMLVSADEASDEVQDWGLYYAAGGPVWTGGSKGPDDVAVASTSEIDEMAERRWLRITGYPSDKGRLFAVAADGRQAWLDHVEANSPSRSWVGQRRSNGTAPARCYGCCTRRTWSVEHPGAASTH
jgi:hypothetical protein